MGGDELIDVIALMISIVFAYIVFAKKMTDKPRIVGKLAALNVVLQVCNLFRHLLM